MCSSRPFVGSQDRIDQDGGLSRLCEGEEGACEGKTELVRGFERERLSILLERLFVSSRGSQYIAEVLSQGHVLRRQRDGAPQRLNGIVHEGELGANCT